MRKVIYLFLILLGGCSNYKAPLGGYPQQQPQQVSGGKRIAYIMDSALSSQPQYRRALLERQQLQYMQLENERTALQNEMMRRELSQYQK